MKGVAEQAAKDRIEGERPGRLRALVAAAVAGAAAGVLAYKFLRSEPDGGSRAGGEPRRHEHPPRRTQRPRRRAGAERPASRHRGDAARPSRRR